MTTTPPFANARLPFYRVLPSISLNGAATRPHDHNPVLVSDDDRAEAFLLRLGWLALVSLSDFNARWSFRFHCQSLGIQHSTYHHCFSILGDQ